MKNINNGIISQHENICLVNNFGYYTIEYYDDVIGAITLVDGEKDDKEEITDIYNNCVNSIKYLELLKNMVLNEQNGGNIVA
jgi:hypothetical protein